MNTNEQGYSYPNSMIELYDIWREQELINNDLCPTSKQEISTITPSKLTS